MRFSFFLIFIALIALESQSGCRKDPLNEDSDAKLEFSDDTIVFDTVFTTIGSATRHFKVYNRGRKAVNITSVKLAGGSTSNFHLNIDGVQAVSTGEIILRGGDSMYVFADVQVDPNNSNSPLMIEDSVQFETNGNRQHVVLNAVGQDAYFHYNTYLTCNEIWTNDKPHVIYGFAVIPSNCMLTIMPGTRVHLHKNGVLAADSAATLKVLGADGNPVTFQGDRLEADYAEEPGQWNFIWLSTQSINNVIDWAVIKNANVGILCDSTVAASPNPAVKITNTRIMNMALAGIYGRDSWIEGDNVAVSNCASYCVAIAYGGKCVFRHCSFGDYWDIDSRTSPCVLLNNWYEISDGVNNYRDLIQADFHNCIIYGPLDNELGLDSNVVSPTQFNYFFRNCIIRTNQNISSTTHFQNIIQADPVFHDPRANDLHISVSSAGKDLGDLVIGGLVPVDLEGNPRMVDAGPDIGAYEYEP
ncbi:MAG: hypothetical protein M3R17_02800 [Bacteroidota bacterium]|nr:hypothetical protein [Bacteroidota bacterium]